MHRASKQSLVCHGYRPWLRAGVRTSAGGDDGRGRIRAAISRRRRSNAQALSSKCDFAVPDDEDGLDVRMNGISCSLGRV